MALISWDFAGSNWDDPDPRDGRYFECLWEALSERCAWVKHAMPASLKSRPVSSGSSLMLYFPFSDFDAALDTVAVHHYDQANPRSESDLPWPIITKDSKTYYVIESAINENYQTPITFYGSEYVKWSMATFRNAWGPSIDGLKTLSDCYSISDNVKTWLSDRKRAFEWLKYPTRPIPFLGFTMSGCSNDDNRMKDVRYFEWRVTTCDEVVGCYECWPETIGYSESTTENCDVYDSVFYDSEPDLDNVYANAAECLNSLSLCFLYGGGESNGRTHITYNTDGWYLGDCLEYDAENNCISYAICPYTSYRKTGQRHSRSYKFDDTVVSISSMDSMFRRLTNAEITFWIAMYDSTFSVPPPGWVLSDTDERFVKTKDEKTLSFVNQRDLIDQTFSMDVSFDLGPIHSSTVVTTHEDQYGGYTRVTTTEQGNYPLVTYFLLETKYGSSMVEEVYNFN